MEPVSPRATIALVFLTGVATMALEMATSRLVAPFFGTTLIAWTLIIGSVMVALSVGSWLGGHRAESVTGLPDIARLLSGSGAFVALLPFACERALWAAGRAPSVLSVLLALVVVVALVSVPIATLAMVSPCAVRLLAGSETVGATAGRVFAAGACGSVLGTLLPAFVLIPLWGTKATIVASGALLLGAGELAQGHHLRALAGVFVAAALATQVGPPKELPGLVHSQESLYNYIQVYDDRFIDSRGLGGDLFPQALLESELWGPRSEKRRFLVLNEGFGVHSVHAPEAPFEPLTGVYYDMLVTLPLLVRQERPVRAAIVGLAGGTIAQQWIRFYGDVPGIKIDGVEIDPAILETGREHCGLRWSDATGHLKCFAEDGRRFFLTRPKKRYDLIALDVYKQPYIPFHLASREYFELLAQALEPGGVIAMNAVVSDVDSELFVGLLSAMRDVFPHVGYLGGPSDTDPYRNSVVLASPAPLRLDRLDPNDSVLQEVARRAKNPRLVDIARGFPGDLHEFTAWDPALSLTDDLSAVEWYSQKMFLEEPPSSPEAP